MVAAATLRWRPAAAATPSATTTPPPPRPVARRRRHRRRRIEQQYYSNEIIAEVYAQALAAAGYEGTGSTRSGSGRFVPAELESGAIDILPESSGNLLHSTTTAAPRPPPRTRWSPPSGRRCRGPAGAGACDGGGPGTRSTSPRSSRRSGALSRSAISPRWTCAHRRRELEFETRPLRTRGPVGGVRRGGDRAADRGLRRPAYGQALQDGTVNVADIYSADPTIQENGFVTLEDPEALVLPQQCGPARVRPGG